jgi:hypothetical protein
MHTETERGKKGDIFSEKKVSKNKKGKMRKVLF